MVSRKLYLVTSNAPDCELMHTQQVHQLPPHHDTWLKNYWDHVTSTVVPLLKDQLQRTLSREDTPLERTQINSWHQVLRMHVMLPLTKGYHSNN